MLLLHGWKLPRSLTPAVLLLACFASALLFSVNSSWRWDLVTTVWRTQPRPSTIPKKLWYKLGPKGLNDDTRSWTDSCIQKNPDYAVQFMTDSSADNWVERTFNASHPDLVQLYLGFRIPIWKADLLRYLLLYAEGGVYCDLDVSCEVPIREWVPPQYQANASLVVGWEFDVGWGDGFTRQFETWTVMAKPGSPHVWMAIQDLVQSFKNLMKEKNLTVEELTRDMPGDVVDATGPRRFTNSVLKSIGDIFNITLQGFEELMEPKMAGDVLVLPGYAFAASMNKYDKGLEVPSPLVKHHYAGTWKNDQGGET